MATLRQIIETFGEDILDAEFSFRVFDGYRNAEHGEVTTHYSQWFRTYGGPDGKTFYLRINCGLERHRLVKARNV